MLWLLAVIVIALIMTNYFVEQVSFWTILKIVGVFLLMLVAALMAWR